MRWMIFDHAYNTARSLSLIRLRSAVEQMAHRTRADSDGNPNVFNLERNDDGLWLNNNWAKPDNTWNPNNKFAFRLRNYFLFPQLIGCGFSFPSCPNSSSNHRTSCRPLQAWRPRLRSAYWRSICLPTLQKLRTSEYQALKCIL